MIMGKYVRWFRGDEAVISYYSNKLTTELDYGTYSAQEVGSSVFIKWQLVSPQFT